jgi:hypothetical protein
MKRYIAQFVKGGFPEQYAVLDTKDGCWVGEPKLYHEANDEAQARNDGSFGETVDFSGAAAWLSALPGAP